MKEYIVESSHGRYLSADINDLPPDLRRRLVRAKADSIIYESVEIDSKMKPIDSQLERANLEYLEAQMSVHGINPAQFHRLMETQLTEELAQDAGLLTGDVYRDNWMRAKLGLPQRS